MQLRTRVTGSGETPCAEAGGAQAEVAPVLLNQDVRGELRRAERAMQAGIDGHRLVNAVLRERMSLGELPAGLTLHQRQRVRSVAVDLVRAREDEDRVRTVFAGQLEHVQRAGGVDGEVGERLASCPVGLGSRVHDQANLPGMPGEDRLECAEVAHVRFDVPIRRAVFPPASRVGAVLASEPK